ncbi:MAG: DUF2283 domain-containing protein [Ignavibacteriae bacterium]|nr:DUF2283 domain-containing protein [Ignavibacteriota bacterium]
MKIEYSKTADALYVSFTATEVARSNEIEEGIVLDFDNENHLIGVEILDASHRLTYRDLVNVNIENLPIET